MKKTIFKVNQMDCPSEESLIRIKLQYFESIKNLEFDLKNRTLTIYHTDDNEPFDTALDELKLGSQLIERIEIEDNFQKQEDSKQRRVLWIVLVINLAFFFIEMTTGIISESMGLVADSLDMLADTFVYGLSLLAVGATVSRKKFVASICGYFQLFLASIGFLEVIRRVIGAEEMPNFETMIYISVFALIANTVCLILLQKTKSKDAHIQASIIFSSNDIIINLGVIAAGLLVWKFDSIIPDLIIGTIVFAIVIRGAVRILKLAK